MTRRSLCVISASAAAIAALVLGGLQSVAWHGVDAPALARWIALGLDPDLLLEPASSSLARPAEPYFGYGRLGISIYMLLGLTLVTGWRRWRSMLGSPLARASILLVMVAAAGDVTAYWLSESAGPSIRRVGFWYVELPALVLAIVMITGVGAWRWADARASRRLVLALPFAVVATALPAYMPHGPLLGLALTLALVFGVRGESVTPSDARALGSTLGPPLGSPLGSPLGPPLNRSSVAIAVAVACIVAGLGLALYRPVLRAGPVVEAVPLPDTDPLEGARLHVFNTGYNRMSWWLVGRERPWRPVPAFVIEDPRTGLFVFDTGFSDAVTRLGEAGLHAPERWVIESRSDPSLALPAQMRAAGLDPERVHTVALSHLHGDHTGQLRAFPNAKILGGPGSAEAAPEDLRERWQEVAFDGETSFGVFEPSVDFIGDGGIVLAYDGGHAEEGMMLLLALDEGPVLLAGDAVVHADWLRSNDVQRIVVDPERAATVRNQVRAFIAATPRASIAYGHDLRGIDCDRGDIVCHQSGSLERAGVPPSAAGGPAS